MVFPYWTYADPPQLLFPKRISAGMIYTMNVTEPPLTDLGYSAHFAVNEQILRVAFGSAESLFSSDTYHSTIMRQWWRRDSIARRKPSGARRCFRTIARRLMEGGRGLRNPKQTEHYRLEAGRFGV